MTPQEKAKELVDKFYQLFPLNKDVNNTDGELHWEYNDWERAKQCALIAVDEIINSEPRCPSNVDWDDVGGTHQYYYEAQREEALIYWQQVKQEIEKL
jgi:hypothetical protein